jgi:hypothetical protein
MKNVTVNQQQSTTSSSSNYQLLLSVPNFAQPQFQQFKLVRSSQTIESGDQISQNALHAFHSEASANFQFQAQTSGTFFGEQLPQPAHLNDDASGTGTALLSQNHLQATYPGASPESRGFIRPGQQQNMNTASRPQILSGAVVQQQYTTTSSSSTQPTIFTLNTNMLSSSPGYSESAVYKHAVVTKTSGNEEVSGANAPSPIKEENLCVVCLSAKKQFCFMNCGHLCLCGECGKRFKAGDKCVICRQTCESVVKIYS